MLGEGRQPQPAPESSSYAGALVCAGSFVVRLFRKAEFSNTIQDTQGENGTCTYM